MSKERFAERKAELQNAVKRLREAVAQPESDLIRDAVIHLLLDSPTENKLSSNAAEHYNCLRSCSCKRLFCLVSSLPGSVDDISP